MNPILLVIIVAIVWGLSTYFIITRWGGLNNPYGLNGNDEDWNGNGGGKDKPILPPTPKGPTDNPKDDWDIEFNRELDVIGKQIEREEKEKELVPYSYCEWKEWRSEKMDNK